MPHFSPGLTADRLVQRDAVEVMSEIASAWLGRVNVAERLGEVRLREHQRQAVARLRTTITEWGGALLADEVGLGKTFVALALAGEARCALIIAPAALRSMWHSAMDRAKVRCEFATYESLSRGTLPNCKPDLLVLDEAHHARNPATRRHRHIATLARRARVLLLSATPLHNSGRDLDALFSIFLGERAGPLPDGLRAALIVRRGHTDLDADVHLPRAAPTVPISRSGGDWILDAIVDLPSHLPPRDGGDGGALLALGLIRRWSSSHAALRASLRRRLATGTILLDALDADRHLTRAELAAWSYADASVQLAFPELVSSGVAGSGAAAGDLHALRTAATIHVAAVRSLLARMGERERDDDDGEIVARLMELRERHAGERIIAFSQFADTVHELWSRMRLIPRTGMITSSHAAIASGRLSREDVLAHFAPSASNRPPPVSTGAVELLLATDMLSEGIDLRDASVVVHLDLPWTAARLEQRVGRSRRMGASHEITSVYSFLPPAAAERVLDLERRLAAKARLPVQLLGACGAPVSPQGAPTDTETGGVVQCAARLTRELARWSETAPESRRREHGLTRTPDSSALAESVGDSIFSSVAATRAGWIAVLHLASGESIIVSSFSDDDSVYGASHAGTTHPRTTCPRAPKSSIPRNDPCAILRCVLAVNAASESTDRPTPNLASVRSVIEEAKRWRVAYDLSQATSPGRIARAALDLLTRRTHDEPAWRRSTTASAAANVRRDLLRPLPAAIEGELRRLLADPPAGGTAPLVAALESIVRMDRPPTRQPSGLVVLILVPDPPSG